MNIVNIFIEESKSNIDYGIEESLSAMEDKETKIEYVSSQEEADIVVFDDKIRCIEEYIDTEKQYVYISEKHPSKCLFPVNIHTVSIIELLPAKIFLLIKDLIKKIDNTKKEDIIECRTYSSSKSAKRVLLIDDILQSIISTIDLLKDYHYFTVSKTMKSTRNILQRERFDVVLMNLYLKKSYLPVINDE